MKKLLLILTLGLFLINFASALDFSTISDNIKGYWEMEESTNAMYDFYGRINGTCQSAVTKQQDGINNYGYDFGTAGTTGCYFGTSSGLNSLTTMTISSWFKLDIDTADYNTIAIDWSAIDKGWMLWIEPDRRIRWNSGDGAGTENDLYSDAIPNDGEWHHVMVTRDGTNIKIYFDGALNKSEANTVNGGTTPNNVSIGYWILPTDHAFSGNLDEIMILNSSLNSTYASELYNSGLGSFPSSSSASSGLFNYSSQSDNSSATYPTVNDSVEHSVFFDSNVTLDNYIFSSNASGSWVNDTAVNLSGTSSWANVTKILNYAKDTIVGWIMYAYNSELWISTSEFIYTIINSLPSAVVEPTFNQTNVLQNDSVLVSVEISDKDGLTDINSVIVGFEENVTTYSGYNSTPLDYEPYGTPLLPLASSPSEFYVESSTIYEEGILHMWYREFLGEPNHYIVYANSTNGINWTEPINTTYNAGATKRSLSYAIKVNSTYYQFMPNYANADESTQDLIVYNSTNKIDWTLDCGGNEITTGGYKKNPAVYYNDDTGLWEGLFEQGEGTFTIYYWNSTDLCSGWTKYNNVIAQGGNADIKKRNGEYIVYYGDMTNGVNQMNISVARGDNLNNNLTMMGKFVVNNSGQSESGETTSNPDVIIIEDENPNFFAKYFIYYSSGDDATYDNAYMVYDSLNRSFDEAHFTGTETNGTENLTLSQEGSSSIWSAEFTNTSEIKIYNLTSIWINDGDDVNYLTYSDVYFEVVGINSPNVTLNLPTSYQNISSNNVNFSCYVKDDYQLINVTLFLNGIENETSTSGLNNTNYTFNKILPEGTYNWTCRATNNFSLSTTPTPVIFNVDLAPTITLNYPTALIDYAILGGTLQLNFTASDTNLDKVWYNYNGTNITIAGALTGVYNLSNITLSTKKNATIYANDTAENLNTTTFNWDYKVFGTAVSYSATSSTTTLEDFYLNFTTNTAVIPVVYLIYDGTEYLSTRTGTTTEHQVYNEIAINDSGTKQFRWKITYGTETIYTNYYNQSVSNVSSLTFVSGVCSAGLTQVMNFTFKDESNLTALQNLTVRFNFQYGVSDSTGASAYAQISNTEQVSLCVNTSTSSTYEIGYGEIEYEKTDYATRRFYVFDTTRISNETINTILYMLPSAQSTSFLIEIRSPTLQPYTNIYTTLLKWYPSENEYKVVEMGKTDDKGQTINKVKIEDVDYRIGIYELNGTLIHLANPIRMICLATPCSYPINVPTTSVNQFDEVYGIEAEIVYSSGVFTLTYNDPSQNTDIMSLQVYSISGTDEDLICESNGTSFTGILSCNVSTYSGLLKAVAVRTASPERTIASLIVDTATTIFTGTFGLFLQFIIVVALAFLGIISPVVAIITSIIALLIGVLLFKTMTYPMLIGIAVLGGIIIHLMKRQ